MRARGFVATSACVAGLCCALSACGATSRGTEDAAAQTRRAAEARRPVLAHAGGAETLAVPRATAGAVHLAMFVDAGSRDATPPQLATAIAWIAAGRSDGVHARVEPDGTEWSLECTRERLAECTAQLAGVLAIREADDTELIDVRARLAAARRRAQTDDGRTADALALAGALEVQDASAFGRAEDDGRVDAAAVARFTAAHYGPSRALFVAAGAVGSEALRDAVTAAMQGAPTASEGRAVRGARRADTSSGPGNTPSTATVSDRVRVIVGESDAVSVALRVGSADRARAIAARVATELRETDEARVSVLGFAVRGGGIVLVRAAGDARARGGVPAWVTREVAALETARREAPDGANAAEELPDDLDELARAYGRAFMTGDVRPGLTRRREGANDEDAALTVGVVVRGERAPSLRVPDPDATLLRETRSTAARARERALNAAAPELRGTITARTASAVLPNGARIEVRTLPGAGTLGLALRFASDAASEPAAVLGRAALTARALVEACAEDAQRDGVDLRALVDAHSFGLVASAHANADGERAEDALLRVVRCALDAVPDEATIEDARRLLITALDAHVDPASHARSLAARALAPETPAVIAPCGDEARMAAVPSSDLRRLLADARHGARISVALAGEVDAAQAGTRLGRRLATLDAGALVAPPALATAAADDVLAAAWRGPGMRVVVTLRADAAALGDAVGDAANGLDARAFALALGERVAAAPGVRFVAADGEVLPAGAFAWIALELDEAALAALPGNVQRANAALGAGAVGEQAVRAVRTRLGAQWAASLASPAVVAAALSAARIEGRTTRLALGDAAALGRVIDALSAARVRYVIARTMGRGSALPTDAADRGAD